MPRILTILLAVSIVLLPTAGLADVAACRTGRIDARVGQVPPDIQQAALAQPQQSIEPLVRWLIRNANDDFHKVKILHDWIAENVVYDVESFLRGTARDATWETALLRRQAVCHGMSSLLDRMCRTANIPCQVIPGHGRGYGFGLGQNENVRDENHAWNAVEIQGRWYLLDVTWDAGYVNGQTYQKRYSTAYLFLEPRQFLHTHFPSDARWQLLDRPVSAEEFAQLPYLEGRFFEQGLRLATDVRRFHPVGDSVQFTIETPADVALIAQLADPAASGGKVDHRVLVRRSGTTANVVVTFPRAGRWNVEILSKPRQSQGMYWRSGTLEFQSGGGSPWTFPETFATIAAMDVYLDTPLYVPLAAGTPQEFKIRVTAAEQVQLRIGEQQWVPMSRAADDPTVYRATATVPARAEIKIVARSRGDGNRYWTLVEWPATP
jgi:hypothetical protein